MKPIIPILLIIGMPFSVLGSYVAFLITYEEYRHHYADKGKPFQLAIQAAIFVFVLFLLILAMLAGIYYMRFSAHGV